MERERARRSIDPGFAVILVTVGAVGILDAGVPELRWFLALVLVGWRSAHPGREGPKNTLSSHSDI